jgi:hypothetical protein
MTDVLWPHHTNWTLRSDLDVTPCQDGHHRENPMKSLPKKFVELSWYI